jgi:CDP-glucose 4,6-dehydratase
MKFLVTGHTGFKGSWLTYLLSELGHEVHGVSLPPRPQALFSTLELDKRMASSHFADLGKGFDLPSALGKVDVLIHLAAQPIVLESWRDPLATFNANVGGTLSALNMAFQSEAAEALIITTDKVYSNNGKGIAFRETDKVGGTDPYSSSKAAADFLSTQFGALDILGPKVVVSRGGNVIGGGDDAPHRLVPDIENAIAAKGELVIRNPGHVRPWQHVLDCLSGYLHLIKNPEVEKGSSWNVGPDQSEPDITVGHFIETYLASRGSMLEVRVVDSGVREHGQLRLDVSQTSQRIGFANRYTQAQAIEVTASWYAAVSEGLSPEMATKRQVEQFESHLPGWLK